MPVPDISRPTRVDAKLAIVSPGAATTAQTVVTCPADTILRVRTVYVCNRTTAARAFTVSIVRSSVSYPIINSASVPINALFNCVTGDDACYLEPGDSLTFTQPTANTLTIFCSYERIT